MTIREATKKIERILYPTVHELNKKDPYFAQEVDEAWLLIRRVALTGYRPSEETTSAGLDMPESPNDEKRRIDQCETDIEMLWDAIDAIRNKLPKEWGK